jgi:hypothetical protein
MATKKKTEEQEQPRHISSAELEAEARSTVAILRAQPRVKFTVMPDGSGDKKIRVKLNGTVWEYPVGREAEAPRDVYELIATRWKAIEQKEAFERRNENRDMGAL